jgi:hypothetical protein
VNNKQQVMVVYAVDINGKGINSPWIYGAYTDHRQGLDIQDVMQSSEEYGHLYWSNNIVLLDKDFNVNKI